MVFSKGTLIITQNRITDRVINRLRKPDSGDILVPGGTVSILGTTSVRSLESLYWLGVLSLVNENFSFDNLNLSQWQAYELTQEFSLEQSIVSLKKKMKQKGLESFSFHTQIMITPGYKFKVIQGLITNYHQPKSTLLLLISAVVGDDWKKIYHFAMENDFRFLSYGDSSLLWL